MLEYVELTRKKIQTDDYTKLNIHPKYKKAISQILDILLKQPYLDNINSIILFGSCAKQTTEGGSDVDILVVSEKDFSLEDIACLRYNVGKTVKDTDVDMVFYKEEAYKNGTMPLTKSIKKDYLVLYKKGGCFI